MIKPLVTDSLTLSDTLFKMPRTVLVILEDKGVVVVVKPIDADLLKDWIDGGKSFTLIDARDHYDYKGGHLPGAVSLLLSQVDEMAEKIVPKGLPLVVYSIDAHCPASGLVAKKLDELGYGPVYDYNPSFADWVDKGYTIER